MPVLKLRILADDIRTASYYDHEDCPIARAIRREGFTYAEVGPRLARFSSEEGWRDTNIVDLNAQVLRMYHDTEIGKQIADFETEITY